MFEPNSANDKGWRFEFFFVRDRKGEKVKWWKPQDGPSEADLAIPQDENPKYYDHLDVFRDLVSPWLGQYDLLKGIPFPRPSN